MGELLAGSSLDGEIKGLLLEKMEQIPERLLFRLKDALEIEQEELDAVAFDIQIFLKEQDERWKNVAEEQKQAADVVVDAWAEKLK